MLSYMHITFQTAFELKAPTRLLSVDAFFNLELGFSRGQRSVSFIFERDKINTSEGTWLFGLDTRLWSHGIFSIDNRLIEGITSRNRLKLYSSCIILCQKSLSMDRWAPTSKKKKVN